MKHPIPTGRGAISKARRLGNIRNMLPMFSLMGEAAKSVLGKIDLSEVLEGKVEVWLVPEEIGVRLSTEAPKATITCNSMTLYVRSSDTPVVDDVVLQNAYNILRAPFAPGVHCCNGYFIGVERHIGSPEVNKPGLQRAFAEAERKDALDVGF